MKNPPGYGSIVKLSGARRRPYMVRITTGYETDFSLQRTKQIRKVLGYYATRKEAIKALADFNAHPFDIENAKITFRQCYEEAKKDFSDARAHNYRSAFRYLEPIADLPIGSIRASQMQKCIDDCQTTQQREIKTVCRKVFTYALQNDIVDRNPSLYLKSNSVPATIEREVFTPDQIRELFDRRSEWWAQVTLILLYSGMRTKELQDLTPDDIDLEGKVIHIRKAKNKSSVRDIPIHNAVFALVSDFKAEPRKFTHNGLNKHLAAKFGRRAHDARHTFATRMRECKVDLLTLQLLLGHTPQTITERIYTHISLQELREAVNMLDYGIGSCYL